MRSTRLLLLAGAAALAASSVAPSHSATQASTADFTVPLPGSGGVNVVRLVLPVRAPAGQRLPARINATIRLAGAVPPTAIVLVAPHRVRRLSSTQGVLESSIVVVNPRGRVAAHRVVPQLSPRFLLGSARPRRVQRPPRGAALLDVRIALAKSGGSRLEDPGHAAACRFALAASAPRILVGAKPLGGTSATDAWQATWRVGCGAATASHLFRYVDLAGRRAPCSALAGHNAAPDRTTTENTLDLRCPEIDIFRVSVLEPGRSSRVSRWSSWASVGVGLSAAGDCFGSTTQWGVGFVCDVRPAMGRGDDFLVHFGPPLPAETLLLVHLVDARGAEWAIVTTIGIGPSPPLGNAGERRQAVLGSSQIGLRPLAGFDVLDGRVDSRVLVDLLLLAERFALAGVGPFVTGHPPFIAGTAIPSNHAFGRAVDISSVGGDAVSDANASARAAVLALVSLPAPLRPTEIGCPFGDLVGLPGVFNNADHEDHLHIGFHR